MKKITGWLLVAFGVVWGGVVLLNAQKSGVDISSTLGTVTVPVLVALLGLYLAGVIKNVK